MSLPTDSQEYDIFQRALALAPFDQARLSFELGVRQGGSSEMILQHISTLPNKNQIIHVAVDRYGSMAQHCSDTDFYPLDYTNEMRNKAFVDLYQIAYDHQLNLMFLTLDDVEYAIRFGSGVPFYDNNHKETLNTYAFIHLDGPHNTELVKQEIFFFLSRTLPGSIIVVDDVNMMNYQDILDYFQHYQWELVEKGNVKAVFKKL